MMDSIMAFLMKYIGGFFDWWNSLIKWPVTEFAPGKTIRWSFVAFWLLLVALMVVVSWVA